MGWESVFGKAFSASSSEEYTQDERDWVSTFLRETHAISQPQGTSYGTPNRDAVAAWRIAQHKQSGGAMDSDANNPEHPVNLPLHTAYTLWQQRFGHAWVTRAEVDCDSYWSVLMQRLHKRMLLEEYAFMDGAGALDTRYRLIEEDTPHANR